MTKIGDRSGVHRRAYGVGPTVVPEEARGGADDQAKRVPAPASDAVVRGAAAAALAPPTFGEFYEQHFVGLVRLAMLLTGSKDVAADLVQDCFVGLHRHWVRVDQPLPYVRRSVMHACASHHRKAARARNRPVERPVTTELGADELSDALAALAPKQRAAIVLRFYDDLSDDDIAQALRCRPATVRSLVHRGLIELRKVIEP